MTEPIRIVHFSDILCVWAYVSQIRCDELLSAFAGRISMDCRYIHVFGAVQNKMDSQWGDRGGIDAYSAHVREVAEPFDHVEVHPDVWRSNTPESSMPSHLLLCGVRSLEHAGDVASGATARVSWAVREAFFRDCADVGARDVLLGIAEGCAIPMATLERQLGSGAAHAALAADLEAARDQQVRSSPTLLLNDGRQRLIGNVGYRVIEANVSELLDRPEEQHSWC